MKKGVINYKLFSIICSVSLVLAGFTLWINRPNSMRVPNFTNHVDYSLVEGSYNFDEFYQLLEDQKGIQVKDVHFKLSEDFWYEINGVSLCIVGYELFETDKEMSPPSNYRLNKSKYFLVAKVDIKNDRDGAVDINEFDITYNEEYEHSRSLKEDDLSIPNNIGSLRYDNSLTVEAHEEYSGYLAFALSPSNFRQLYFDGSTLIDFPHIVDKSKIDSRNLFSIQGNIELPIVSEVEEKHLQTVKNLPTSMQRGFNGFTTVTDQATPNATLINSEETLSVTVEKMELGYFEYRPEYIAKRRNKSAYERKTYYQSIRIQLTNLGTQSMNTSELKLSVDLKSNSYPQSAYVITNGLNVSQGETIDLLFDTQYSESTVEFIPGQTYRVILSSSGQEILLEGDFELK